MWGTFLSEPLSIVGLVGRYPANCLIERMPIHQRWIFNKYSHAEPLFYGVLVRLSPGYPPLMGRLHTRYSPVRRSPSMSIATHHDAPRLACVKPVASVHPEPGSNSSLLICLCLCSERPALFKFYSNWRYCSYFNTSLVLLVDHVIFSKNFSFFLFQRSVRNVAAKVSTFFSSPNVLEKNFWKKFLRFSCYLNTKDIWLTLPTSSLYSKVTTSSAFPSSSCLVRRSLSNAGAKVVLLNISSKLFGIFFSYFFHGFS